MGLLDYVDNDKNSSSHFLTLCDMPELDTFTDLVRLVTTALVYSSQPSLDDASNHPLSCL